MAAFCHISGGNTGASGSLPRLRARFLSRALGSSLIFSRLPAELVFVFTFFISGCLSRRNNVDDFLFWGAAVYEYDQQQYQPSARTDSLIALLTFLLDEVVFGDD